MRVEPVCDGKWAALAAAGAPGKSPDLSKWVIPHQEAKTEGAGEARKTAHAGRSFVSPPLLPFFHPQWGCWGCSGGGGGRGGGDTHTHSAVLFLSLLPGAVQFLDPSPPISSRLLLSISCSSLLPPRLPWSPPSATDTSTPGTSFSRWNIHFQSRAGSYSGQLSQVAFFHWNTKEHFLNVTQIMSKKKPASKLLCCSLTFIKSNLLSIF